MLIHTGSPGASCSTRLRISSAALLVKVRARICRAGTPCRSRLAIAVRDDARLAAAGPGQDQQRAIEMLDGLALGRRQRIELFAPHARRFLVACKRFVIRATL